MKKIIRKFKEKLTFKEAPPPYRESDDNGAREPHEYHDPVSVLPSDALDLLTNCKEIKKEHSSPEVEYAEIQDMGLWHSTPLPTRHKSKISLTWVLKQNLGPRNIFPEKRLEGLIKSGYANDVPKDIERQNRRHNQRSIENERRRKCKPNVPERVVGRNEYYHNLRFRSACEEFVSQVTLSDDSSVSTEYARRKHKHRHRRKKRRQEGRFGYDIRDLDSFLTEATIDRPGNIPVVIAYPSTLYQTHKPSQQELALPLGTVVNAVFKSHQWLFAQTPHGHEGYVLYAACLPLGILPARPSSQKKTPCWESSTDIYPRPCGNLTDNDKEQLRGRTRSETRYRTTKRKKPRTSHAEENFDNLYLKTKSVCSDMDRVGKEQRTDKTVGRNSVRQTLLVVNSDFKGSALNNTLTVIKGDVVVLRESGGDKDVDWFYVMKRDGSHGFIPADVAGHGFI